MSKTYSVPQMDIWQGRIDDTNDRDQFRWHQIIKPFDLAAGANHHSPSPKSTTNKNIALLGFACDEGVRRNQGRIGASAAPPNLRRSLANLPVHFENTHQLWDAGDHVCEAQGLEQVQNDLAQSVLSLLTQSITPIVLGGGHEVAFGHGLGVLNFLKKEQPQSKLGIINFDAHYDLRPLVNNQGTSGTPFLQLAHACQKQKHDFHYMCVGLQQASNSKALFKTAHDLKVCSVMRDDILGHDLENIQRQLDGFIAQVDHIYLTICLDVFAASIAPGVSAPAANGLTLTEFNPLFDHILESQKVLSFDIAELNPQYDQDQQTARLAAHIIHKFVAKTAI